MLPARMIEQLISTREMQKRGFLQIKNIKLAHDCEPPCHVL